jgi:hypothetical protein
MNKVNNVNIILLIIIFGIIGWISSKGIKSQFVRLFDIVIYGPILLYIGIKYFSKQLSILTFMLFLGSTTISYNLKNYLSNAGIIKQ